MKIYPYKNQKLCCGGQNVGSGSDAVFLFVFTFYSPNPYFLLCCT